MLLNADPNLRRRPNIRPALDQRRVFCMNIFVCNN